MHKDKRAKALDRWNSEQDLHIVATKVSTVCFINAAYLFCSWEPQQTVHQLTYRKINIYQIILSKNSLSTSVGDPDPRVIGPPGSGSISQRYGSASGTGSGSFPFLIKVLSGLN
jgi:hypothetical protein